jgi:hypothetical protein
MSIIDVNDVQLVTELSEASGMSMQDVRDVIELLHGDEFEIRNYLQNLLLDRASNRRRKATRFPEFDYRIAL